MAPSSLIRRGVVAARELLGLPVEYTRDEFRERKAGLDWSGIDRARLEAVAALSGLDTDDVAGFVAELEADPLFEPLRHPDELGVGGTPMGWTDVATLYATARATRPRLVIETGTGRGGSARALLAAMARNGRGRLISIDPRPDREAFAAMLTDPPWPHLELVSGTCPGALDALPADQLADLDLFVHDSAHTYACMTAEYRWAARHLSPEGGVVASHDVLLTNAWQHFVERTPTIRQHHQVKNLGLARLAPS